MNAQIRPIRSVEDYDAMVALVDRVIDADPGTPDYEALQIASDLVWAWEQQNVEVLPPDPIEAIKFRLEQLGLSLRDLRPYLGSDARISEIFAGKRDLTLKMVRALHQHLNIPLDSLVHERTIDLDEDPEVGKYPISEMMKAGWLGIYTDQKSGYEEEALQDLRRRGEASAFEMVLCRQNANSYVNAKTDAFALHAWCLHVRAVAKQAPIHMRYQPEVINRAFVEDLAHVSRFEKGPALAKEKLEAVGIHLVVARHLRGTYLDGAAMLLADGSPVIGMTLRHDRLDNFWHCLLHELAHVWLHLGRPDCPSFFHDDFDVKGELNRAEQEADQMATNATLPDEALESLGNLTFVSTGDVYDLAETYRIDPSIVAGRIRFETGNYSKFAKLLGHGVPKKVLGVTW